MKKLTLALLLLSSFAQAQLTGNYYNTLPARSRNNALLGNFVFIDSTGTTPYAMKVMAADVVRDAILASPIKKLTGAAGTPTVVANTAAGSGATVSITGTNLSGKITLNTGLSLLSTGAVLTMTLAGGATFPNHTYITFTAGNDSFASALTKIYATTTTGTIVLNTVLSLSIGTTYTGYYFITGD